MGAEQEDVDALIAQLKGDGDGYYTTVPGWQGGTQNGLKRAIRIIRAWWRGIEARDKTTDPAPEDE